LFLIKIYIGFILDLVFKDPYWFPHPVRLVGKLITILERFLYKLKSKKVAGYFLCAFVVISCYFFVVWLISFSYLGLIEVFIIYTIFATGSLALEARKVHSLLENGDLEGARVELSYLVSRDTDQLSRERVIVATIETVSENIVDAIIAPMFYLFLGGVPFAFAYKAASTLDSMVGYKNERYYHFGYASARLDDVLNFIPARITAFLLIPLAALVYKKDALKSLKIVKRDRLNHASPNSAHAEAAVAGALGIQLGGEAVYFGKKTVKPTIGVRGDEAKIKMIKQTIVLVYLTAVLGLVLFSLIYWLIKFKLKGFF
jgi:adenosylcobinamide-phosphate synthase